MRVLVVAPHPDDEVLGCGGAMARHVATGDEVHVLVMTRGVSALFPQESVESLRKEMLQAHGVLGVKTTRFLDFPAPQMDTVPRHEIADAIGVVLQEILPHTLYTPHPGDMHFEHGLTFEACLVAARPIGLAKVNRILAYETLSETEWAPAINAASFQPNVFVN
ncbi:MAG TPA: PIG-L deacetylase family protein, partial [Pirellulales bacterium]